MGEENTSTTRTTVGIRKRDSSGDQCPLHTWPKWHSWAFERTLMDIVRCMLITSGPFFASGVKLSHAVFIHKQSYFQNWWAYSLWLLEREETHLSEIRIFGPRAFIREPLVSSNWNHGAKKEYSWGVASLQIFSNLYFFQQGSFQQGCIFSSARTLKVDETMLIVTLKKKAQSDLNEAFMDVNTHQDVVRPLDNPMEKETIINESVDADLPHCC